MTEWDRIALKFIAGCILISFLAGIYMLSR